MNITTSDALASSPAAQKPQPSYYAIIPADVRYHPDLPASAKLLYGEITALCNKEGYCWSLNDYFAELYGVKVLSIKRWIAALENAGFVTVLLDRTGTRRRIILGEVTAKKIRDGIKNDTGWYPKRYAPRIKKDTHNTTLNTKENNKENIAAVAAPELLPSVSKEQKEPDQKAIVVPPLFPGQTEAEREAFGAAYRRARKELAKPAFMAKHKRQSGPMDWYQRAVEIQAEEAAAAEAASLTAEAAKGEAT